MTNLIVVKQLSKEFQKYKAIDNLNFTVEKGEILVFLGPSGSGKTTTINILTGQLTPSQGETYILGKSSLQLKEDDLSKIGLITENSGFYEKLTLYDNLLFFAKLYNVSTEYVDDLLKRVGLYDHRKTLAEKLSTGMKQRMLLVRAIINKPKVLFLDEPTAGLDVEGRLLLHQQIRQLNAMGKTIVLASHDMTEVETLCDRIAILSGGRIAFTGTVEQLQKRMGKHYNITIRTNAGTERYESDSIENTLFELLIKHREKSEAILDIQVNRGSLEQHFMKIAKEG